MGASLLKDRNLISFRIHTLGNWTLVSLPFVLQSYSLFSHPHLLFPSSPSCSPVSSFLFRPLYYLCFLSSSLSPCLSLFLLCPSLSPSFFLVPFSHVLLFHCISRTYIRLTGCFVWLKHNCFIIGLLINFMPNGFVIHWWPLPYSKLQNEDFIIILFLLYYLELFYIELFYLLGLFGYLEIQFIVEGGIKLFPAEEFSAC